MAFDGVIPAGTLESLPYGLFSVADVKERGPKDEHWGQGFSAMSEACNFNAKLIDVCEAVQPVDVYVADGDRFKRVRPFGVLALDECLSVGHAAEDRRARVVRQLEIVTPKAIETELWAGPYRSAWDTEMAGDAIPLGYLAHADTDVVEATAQKPKVALALLEQAVASCSPGWQATIHLTPLVASVLADSGAFEEKGGKLYTKGVGNLVAVGSGYDGRMPGETDAPASPFIHAMYVSGPVHVVIGSKELITTDAVQATNVRTNEMLYAAERPAAVYTEGCCQFAVKTDIRL